MKKVMTLFLAAVLVLNLGGCAKSPAEEKGNTEQTAQTTVETDKTDKTDEIVEQPEEPESPDPYDAIIQQYVTAVTEGWDEAKMMENNLNYMVPYCLKEDERASVGYFKGDLNGDGEPELAIAAKSESAYFTGMIFALYAPMDGQLYPLVESGERDRWYYAGEGKLCNEASGNAFESIISLCTADWQLAYLDAVGRNSIEYPDDPWLRFTGDTWEHLPEDEANAVMQNIKDQVRNLDITVIG